MRPDRIDRGASSVPIAQNLPIILSRELKCREKQEASPVYSRPEVKCEGYDGCECKVKLNLPGIRFRNGYDNGDGGSQVP